MTLWIVWLNCIKQLKPSCRNNKTFLWLTTIVSAFSIREDLLGVTSFVRSLNLKKRTYPLLLHFFHSSALKYSKLVECWITLCLSIYKPFLYLLDNKMVVIVDGLKNAKEGKKMPAVKSLHQESENNKKPTFIMGHNFECFSLLVGKRGQYFAVPLFSRLSGGVIFSKAEEDETLLDRVNTYIASAFKYPVYLLADSYYAVKKIMVFLRKNDHHLITRTRMNVVAWEERQPVPVSVPVKNKKKKRGRKAEYGKKIKVRELFKAPPLFKKIKTSVYGEKKVVVSYLILDALLRPHKLKVRFLLVIHPHRGKIILLSTDRSLTAMQLIRSYALRFKIELSFKQSIQVIGSYAYHFWMKGMKKIKKYSKDQVLSKKRVKYRQQVKRKLTAYEVYVQLGLIAQGLMIYLSLMYKREVWKHLQSWFRTQNKKRFPTERVVADSLRSTLGQFLEDSPKKCSWKKFVRKRTRLFKKSSTNKAA